MSAKKARRKLARKVIWDCVGAGAFISWSSLTHDLTDREFDRLVDEIRKARVTVTWPDEEGK